MCFFHRIRSLATQHQKIQHGFYFSPDGIPFLRRFISGMHHFEMNAAYITIELIIAVLAIIGNVLVCWAVAINTTLKNATNYFLVSLAVADILVGFLAIPFAITISIGFNTDFHGCLFLACFVLVLTQSSIFSLLAVAVDRYLAVKIPLR